jgi:hypothetical protein
MAWSFADGAITELASGLNRIRALPFNCTRLLSWDSRVEELVDAVAFTLR